MAPVEVRHEASLVPITVLGIHIFLAVSLTLLVTQASYRSYLALPSSQGTRTRGIVRRDHVKVFAALAALSLGLAGYWAYAFAHLSYRVWAAQRGVELPESIFGDKGAFCGGEHPGRLQIARWLSDTPIHRDFREIVAAKARRYWWRQQLDLSSISWGVLLAIEGRRRNIPHLWAYIHLSNLISLSFAQNLFYLALLLTPGQVPENVREVTREPRTLTRLGKLQERSITKPSNWFPLPKIYILCLIPPLTAVGLTPTAMNTTSFITITDFARFLVFLPLILPYVVPERWGTVDPHPSDSHSTYDQVFKTISIVSLLLHGKSTTIALFYNDPGSQVHRHNLFDTFKAEQRDALDRGSTAIGKVLGAIGDHPAVGAVGWDVLLSGLSLGLWAAARGLDVEAILSNCGFPTGEITQAKEEAIAKVKETELSKQFEPPTPRRRGRPRKKTRPSIDDSQASRKGRRKEEGDKASVTPEPPSAEGDVIEEDDWEIGALAWGIISTMGLGVGSAGVFGAEVGAK